MTGSIRPLSGVLPQYTPLTRNVATWLEISVAIGSPPVQSPTVDREGNQALTIGDLTFSIVADAVGYSVFAQERDDQAPVGEFGRLGRS